MMNITKTAEGEKLTVALEGRLDTLTAPELEESLSSVDGMYERMGFKDLGIASSVWGGGVWHEMEHRLER